MKTDPIECAAHAVSQQMCLCMCLDAFYFINEIMYDAVYNANKIVYNETTACEHTFSHL